MENYSEEYLDVDIIQISHHGLNPLDDLYKTVRAEYAFYPQRFEAAPRIFATSQALYNMVVASISGGLDNIYFGGNCTARMTVVNGKIQMTKNELVGELWDGKEMLYIFPKG